MDMQNFNQMLLASIGVGLAVIDVKSHEILFTNPLFAIWFPVHENGSRKISCVLGITDLDDLVETIRKPFTGTKFYNPIRR